MCTQPEANMDAGAIMAVNFKNRQGRRGNNWRKGRGKKGKGRERGRKWEGRGGKGEERGGEGRGEEAR